MNLRECRWNFSSRSRELSGGNAIIVSVPKSGRTWVRTFLCAYFCECDGHPFAFDAEKYGRIPRMIFSHDRFEQRTKADFWDRLRGKYLILANHALAFSDFDNMKKLEAAGAFDSKILQPGDAHDPESFKVRRGKVGGYIDYLEGADIAYVAEVMRKLDPRFGYERDIGS